MESNYMETLKKIIDANWEEEMACLGKLISYRSVAEGPDAKDEDGNYIYNNPDAPFGQAVQDVFECALKMGEDMGFTPKNVDNYGGHLEMAGTGDKVMGIVGHLDVVPEGDFWDTDPYEMVEKDGLLYGRGVNDDKGPVVAALYAMKAIKEAGFEPHTATRLIFGLDEETNWYGMRYYLAHETAPDFGFTPDGIFPVINGEKGFAVMELEKDFGPAGGEGLKLVSIKGGSAPNMVADTAKAFLKAADDMEYENILGMAAARKAGGDMDITAEKKDGGVELFVKGKAAHGANPELGVNAISQLMDFLSVFKFDNEGVNDVLAFYKDHIGYEVAGERLGIGFEDEISGKMVVNVGLIEGGEDSVKITLCIRTPISTTHDELYDGIAGVVEPAGFKLTEQRYEKPLYMPADHPMIKTMVEIYQSVSGDLVTQPRLIAGATYARAFDNLVAFGAFFPGTTDTAHQANEYFSVEDFYKTTLIYADTIYRLTVA